MADDMSEVSGHSSSSGATTRRCVECKKLMPSVDLHSICDQCSATLCSFDQRCAGCADWSDQQMRDYVSQMRKLILSRERKRRSRARARESTASSARASPSVVSESAAPPEGGPESSSVAEEVVSPDVDVSPTPPAASASSVGLSKKTRQSKVEHSVDDLVSPSDSVSCTSSKVARLVKDNLKDFQASQGDST